MKRLYCAISCGGMFLIGCQDAVTPELDLGPPTLFVSVPSAGHSVELGDTLRTWIRTAGLTVSGEASDDLAVTRVTYSVDAGSEVDVAVQPGRAITFSAQAPLTSAESIVEMRAYDDAGNFAATWLRVTVDSVPPVLDNHLQAPALTTSAGGDEVIGWNPLPVRLFAGRQEKLSSGDILGGLTYRIDDGPETAASQGCLVPSCKDPGYRADILLPVGSYSLQLTARDLAGNTDSRTFPMRIVPLPEATIETQDTTVSHSTSTLTITGRVSSIDGVNLQYYRLVVDDPGSGMGGTVAIDSVSGRFEFDLPLAVGENRISVFAGMYPLHDWFTFVPFLPGGMGPVSDAVAVRREES